tara:strand:- start:3914 stop:4147 length:234 start_codon:yes stop_codon:yes gene_type:complete
MIKVGDIVELLPTNNRNRQLRGQENKHMWEVVQIKPVMCFGGDLGFDIKHLGSEHSRWVTVDEIQISEFRENRKDVY